MGRTLISTLLIVAVVLSVFAAPAAAATPVVSASGDTASPGETVTVSVTVEDSQSVEIETVPANWTVASKTTSGAFFYDGDTNVGWLWDADQGSQSVSVTFDVPADASLGDQQLAVIAGDSDGNTTSTMATVAIEDGTAPTADAGSDQTVSNGTAVGFDGSGSSDNVGIASYEWAFGDGTTATGATPSHTYGSTGTYTATLTVTDDAGNTDTDTIAITVEDTIAPTADAGSDQTVSNGTAVSFDGSASTDNVAVVSYEWDFDDGTTATGATPSHTYGSTGTYTATLTVTDDAGNTDTDTIAITVEGTGSGTPAVSAGGDTAAPGETATLTVTVEDSQTAEIENRPADWTVASKTTSGALFYDGDTSVGWAWGSDQSSQSVSVTFDIPADATLGDRQFDVKVEDSSARTASTTATVSVSDDTAPTADAGSDRTVTVDDAVTFDGSGSSDNVGIASYEWDFGDGTTASGTAPTHGYTSPGQYTATLIVTDDAGNTDSDAIAVIVEDTTAPVADAGPNQSATVGQTVSFDGLASTDNVGVDSYSWSLGDGMGAVGPVPSHSYTEPGNYTVELRVSDRAGNSGTDTLTVRVTSEPSTPTVPGAAGPAQSVNGDPQLEDVDGDGSADVIDALVYYQNRNSDSIRDNPTYFDFDGDGVSGTVFDALALYEKIS